MSLIQILKYKSLSFLPLTILLFGCASHQTCEHNSRLSLDVKPPIKSFVKILVLKEDGTKFSTASGVVFSQTTTSNTAIVTAKHVCEGPENATFKVLDHKKIKHEAIMLHASKEKDICILSTLTPVDAKPVKLSKRKPLQGHSSYNIAAPYGIYDSDMALIFHGHYSGLIKIKGIDEALDVYTIPGGGGSSGSPIFNEDWELIGIISRGHVRMQHIMLSVQYEYVLGYLSSMYPLLPELTAKKTVEFYMNTIKAK